MELPPNAFEQGPIRKIIEHVFTFSGRQVHVKLIACPHDDEVDTRFIKSALGPLEDLHGKTIFIEQGSQSSTANTLGELKRIASEDFEIGEDLREREITRWSVLSDEYEQFEPFAVVSNYALSQGIEVINMDAAMNSTPEVIEFLLNEGASQEFIIEIVYGSVRNTTLKEGEIVPKLLIKLLPFSEDVIKETCVRLYAFYNDETGGDSIEGASRRSEIRDYWYFLREKFMFETLKNKLKEGDVFIAHPSHIKGILAQSESLVEKPPVPKIL